MTSTNLGRAAALLLAVSSGNADAATRHLSPDRFVQHDPTIADGISGLRERAARTAANGSLQVVRLLEDCK